MPQHLPPSWVSCGLQDTTCGWVQHLLAENQAQEKVLGIIIIKKELDK